MICCQDDQPYRHQITSLRTDTKRPPHKTTDTNTHNTNQIRTCDPSICTTQHPLSSPLNHSRLKNEVEFLQGISWERICAEIQANMGPSFVTWVLSNARNCVSERARSDRWWEKDKRERKGKVEKTKVTINIQILVFNFLCLFDHASLYNPVNTTKLVHEFS
jgi:hypothetical protein